MLGLSTRPKASLIALRFEGDTEFRRAVRIAAAASMPVDAPGQNTLIVQRSDIAAFSGLKFVPEEILEKVANAERASLRRRLK
jgi:hypothetical protein